MVCTAAGTPYQCLLTELPYLHSTTPTKFFLPSHLQTLLSPPERTAFLQTLLTATFRTFYRIQTLLPSPELAAASKACCTPPELAAASKTYYCL